MHIALQFASRRSPVWMMTMLWRDGYGAIPGSVRQDGSPRPFIPGPENAKTSSDRWRKAPVWILVFIVQLSSIPSNTRSYVCLDMRYTHPNQDELQHLKQ